MDEQTITISKKEWDKLQNQLIQLRKENKQLKQQNLTTSYSPNIFLKKSQQIPKLAKKFSGPQSKNQLKKSMTQWSKVFDHDHYKCFQKQKNLQNPPKIEENFEDDEDIEISLNSQENQQFAILGEQPLIEEQQNQLKLLECVCLYGPNKEQVQQSKNSKKMMTRSQLHYISQPSQSKKYEGYGSYFYPEGQIKTRKIREEDIMTHINKIIFKKNTKKDECLIYLFQKDENNELLKHRNEVLENINPGKWLTVFCVQFYDYFTFDDDGLNFEGIENKSFEEKSQPSERSESIPTEQESSSPNVHNRSANLTKTIKMTAQKSSCLVSKFTLCIFTYFPLVSLMEQILISIVDEIKQRRISAYAQENEKIQDINYEFFISQLSEICKKINTQLSEIPPQIGSNGTIVIGSESAIPLTIQLTKQNINSYFYSGWAYQLIKQFEKDKIYEIYCSIFLEETVILLCENLHLLTYMIFFFVIGLPRPLYYPHPCISVIFNLQLLDTPFIVTAGINNTSKWLKENLNLFSQKIVFIDLNKFEEVSIFDKKRPYVKSQKLRKVFSNLYKKIDTPLFKKKQKIIKSTSKQENEIIYKFVKGLNHYFKQEIFNYLPKKQLIECMHKNVEDTNESNKVSMLLKQIFKFIRESRKEKDNNGKEKDMFLNQFDEKDRDSILNIINKENQNHISFFSTQIFSVFLSDYYGFY